MRLLLHPFGLLVSGAVGTAEQGSDRYVESQLLVIAGTRIGERDMCPPFGVADAAFAAFSGADIQTCLDRYGPDGIVITEVTTDPGVLPGQDTDSVSVSWARRR